MPMSSRKRPRMCGTATRCSSCELGYAIALISERTARRARARIRSPPNAGSDSTAVRRSGSTSTSKCQARERSRLYNASTLVTLTAGVLICYLAPVRCELGVGVLRPRPGSDGRVPEHIAGRWRPVRSFLVCRVSSNRRRWHRLRPGVGRGDPRRRLLQARGGSARASRARSAPPRPEPPRPEPPRPQPRL